MIDVGIDGWRSEGRLNDKFGGGSVVSKGDAWFKALEV